MRALSCSLGVEDALHVVRNLLQLPDAKMDCEDSSINLRSLKFAQEIPISEFLKIKKFELVKDFKLESKLIHKE